MKKSYVLMCVLLSATLLTACGDKISTEEIKSAIQDSVPSISQLAEGPTAITFKTDNGELYLSIPRYSGVWGCLSLNNSKDSQKGLFFPRQFCYNMCNIKEVFLCLLGNRYCAY